jgi:dimeric dUTPase (all-alpha-NTP-PPase superfamily)
MEHINFDFLFQLSKKKNLELILKSNDNFELIYFLSDDIFKKLPSLEKNIKKKKDIEPVLSEIVTASFLIGYLFDKDSLSFEIDEIFLLSNVNKQFNGLFKQLNKFLYWKSRINYIEFLGLLLGLMHMIDVDLQSIQIKKLSEIL